MPLTGNDGLPALPRVTIIVPVWNAVHVIAQCLKALINQNYPTDLYQICVVDNGSDDGTRDIVRNFETVHLLHEREPGSYAARNRALAIADGDYVAFTDADCIPSTGWLLGGVREAIAHPRAGVIGGRIDVYRQENGSGLAATYERLFAFRQEKHIAAGYCTTANWLSPLEVIKAAGGFDARLRSGGDYDLCERIRAKGRSIVYAPDMVLRHPARPSVAALARKRARTTAGAWQRQTGAVRRMRFLAGALLAVFGDIRMIVTVPDMAIACRLGVVATVLWLAVVQFGQICRMMVGASAPRS